MSGGRPLTTEEVIEVYGALRLSIPGASDRMSVTSDCLSWASEEDTDLRLATLRLMRDIHRGSSVGGSRLTARRDEAYAELRNLTHRQKPTTGLPLGESGGKKGRTRTTRSS